MIFRYYYATFLSKSQGRFPVSIPHPSRSHPAVFPQISHKLHTVPQKSPKIRRFQGRTGTIRDTFPIARKPFAVRHVGSNPTPCAKRLSVVIITAYFFNTFDGRYVPLDFTMEIYRINQVYVLKIVEDRKNSRNFFLFML